MKRSVDLTRWFKAPYRKFLAARQADQWATRISDGDLSQRDLDAFVTWLTADSIHGDAYKETVRVWSSPLPFSPSELEGLLAEPRKLPETGPRSPKSSWQDRGFATFKMRPLLHGGVLAAAIAVAWSATTFFPVDSHNHVTAIGKRTVIELPEGSFIHLNTQSQVNVEFTEGVRFVSLLAGEAFFDVAPDKNRPFVVQTQNASVRALGTRFNVRSEASRSVVAVLEGAVEVKGQATDGSFTVIKETVEEGQLLTYNVNDGVTDFGEQNVTRVAAWIEGRVEFGNVPLVDAVAEINRYRTKPITIRDPELQALNISGSFDIDTTSSFVVALSRMDFIEVVERANEITVVKID